ncbi:MAG TPA: hypothetical protein VLH79_11145 [Chthonomonadales bacterium]|nr:hypothetical protein [Chthonomonadales bacterium]
MGHSPKVRRNLIRLCAALAGVVVLAASAGVASAQRRGDLVLAPTQPLLLFPFDVADITATNGPEISQLLTDVAGSRARIARTYMVTEFYRTFPPVARLHSEQQLTDADVTAPFGEDNRKAARIIRAIEYEFALVGGIAEYSYDAANRRVTITVSGRLLQATTDAVGYRVARSALGTGTSPAGGPNTREEELALAAARAAGEQLVDQLLPRPAPAPAAVTPVEPVQPRRGRHDWIWGAVAVGLGLGIGLSTAR